MVDLYNLLFIVTSTMKQSNILPTNANYFPMISPIDFSMEFFLNLAPIIDGPHLVQHFPKCPVCTQPPSSLWLQHQNA